MKRLINFPLFIFLLTVIIFFKPFFFEHKNPIPSDTIIGLYHPFRDLYAKEYPNGIPYKNFLITDPVRQQYPWRFLAIEQERSWQLPLWNPYSFAGTPLLASLQSAAFYPLNIIFSFLSFSNAWSILVLLQPILAGIFLYLYLRNLGLYRFSSLFAAITFTFCGFFISWLEWNTIGHVVLWLPLILLAIDKIFYQFKRFDSSKFKIKNYFWPAVFLFSLCSSFLAGHLQLFFYIFVVSFFYFLAKWILSERSKNILVIFLILAVCFLIITFIQWYPLLQFIGLSARAIDQSNWQQIEGWFIPWQHLIQFVAPDFFGNPTTLNYWGTWNYGELIGYIGIVPLIMAWYAIVIRQDKKTLFFASIFVLSLLFSLPTILAKLPYILNIPFLATSQPTRLLFLTDFSLAILAGFGMDWYIRQDKKRDIFIPISFLLIILGGLWLFVLRGSGENMLVTKNNLYLPTVFVIFTTLIIIASILVKKNKLYFLFIGMLLIITIVDLFRFAHKFTPFTNQEYLFPQTKVISFLQKDPDVFRIMTTDPRILPPNFSSMYGLQSVDGYDPLFLRSYAELIAALERNKPDITPPFGFNRIVKPENSNSSLINLLNVKYVLSFSELLEPRFTKVFEEGQTKVYQNNQVLPRTFFVANIKQVQTKQETINAMLDSTVNLRKTAVTNLSVSKRSFGQGRAKILHYSENKVVIQTDNRSVGFLVLTDAYYPSWKAKMCSSDERNCKELPIFLTNYHFRGVIVSEERHHVIFYNTLL